MNENTYRFCKIILLATLTAGLLVIGWQWASNGRYVQFDVAKTYSPNGTIRLNNEGNQVIDTRTGHLISAK